MKHPFEEASNTCRTCGHEYCADCLVYSFGADKPPFCIPCALVAGGLRRRGPAPKPAVKVATVAEREPAMAGASESTGRRLFRFRRASS